VITGIVNAAGLTEDRPAASPAPTRGKSREFDRALRHASHQSPEPDTAAQTRDVSGSDPRARESFGQRGSASPAAETPTGKAPDGEKVAASDGPEEKFTSAETAAATQQAPTDITAQVMLAGMLKAAGKPAPTAGSNPGEALTFSAATAQQATAQPKAGVQAAIGDAAYRLSDHGTQEAKFAELAGKPLSTEQVQVDAKAALARVEKPVVDPLQAERAQSARDLLQMALKAQQTQQPQAQAAKGLADEGTAARNPLLMQYAQHMEQGAMGIAARAGGDAPHGGKSFSAFDRADGQPGLTASGLHVANHGRPMPVTAPTADQASQLIDRVVQEARWSITNNQKEVTFKLHPESLGEMSLKVSHKDGLLKLDMTVENHMVKSLLESRIHDLRNQLTREDLHAGEFMFNVDVNKGNQQHESPNQLAQEAGRGITPVRGHAAVESASVPLARVKPLWGMTGTGIYA